MRMYDKHKEIKPPDYSATQQWALLALYVHCLSIIAMSNIGAGTYFVSYKRGL